MAAPLDTRCIFGTFYRAVYKSAMDCSGTNADRIAAIPYHKLPIAQSVAAVLCRLPLIHGIHCWCPMECFASTPCFRESAPRPQGTSIIVCEGEMKTIQGRGDSKLPFWQLFAGRIHTHTDTYPVTLFLNKKHVGITKISRTYGETRAHLKWSHERTKLLDRSNCREWSCY